MAWENGGGRIGQVLRLICRLIGVLRVKYSSFGKGHIGFLSLDSCNGQYLWCVIFRLCEYISDHTSI